MPSLTPFELSIKVMIERVEVIRESVAPNMCLGKFLRAVHGVIRSPAHSVAKPVGGGEKGVVRTRVDCLLGVRRNGRQTLSRLKASSAISTIRLGS